MKRFLKILLIAIPVAVLLSACRTNEMSNTEPKEDSYLWLEDVTGDKQLSWVREQNKLSQGELEAIPLFTELKDRFRKILDSREKIPMVTQRGKWLYNFWQDDLNPKGLIRRATLEEYKKDRPDWKLVLDIDQLARTDGENWVYKGHTALKPDYRRTLLKLSRGGADAVVIREFDLDALEFVEDGFELPEAKTSVSWKDENTLYVSSDFGEGSLTESGYPRIVKEWKRGTPLENASVIYEGEEKDVYISASTVRDHGFEYDFINRAITFWTSEVFLRRNGELIKIDKQDDAEVDVFKNQLLLTLRSDWEAEGKVWPAGALLAAPLENFLKGERDFEMLFIPTPRTSLDGTSATKNWLIVNELDNVKNRLYRWKLSDGAWKREDMDLPGLGSVSAWGVESDVSDDYWLSLTDFLTPSSLYRGTIGQGAPTQLKSMPSFFETRGLEIQQFEATSKDGTKVPYFQVSRKDMKLDGSNPTQLYGYGGFEISLLSRYLATSGVGWMEKGGVYVLANIRGGGEFGPRWHQAALKANRQKAYDDFIAIAEDLVERKVTSPDHLGIRGGSNGGLLMGNMLVQRPDLFKAIVCQVPLLDMWRYDKLLAGASWVGEYGDPDKPEEWAFLRNYSPYHLVREGVGYPRVLFTTSTRDDRVHPAHARKMVARMKEQGHDVLYYENIEGGHGGAANNEQRAYMEALAYTFLWNELK